MNIGIATFSNAMSYGAVLQAFALKTCIEEMGHNAFVIDIECSGNIRFDCFDEFYSYSSRGKKTPRRFVKLLFYRFIQKRRLQKKIANFESFRNNKLYFPKKANVDCKGLDLVVCGSDQIWNPTITKGFFDIFFGINESGVPAISYAGSVGDVAFIKGTEKEKDFFNKISNFKAVSFREDDLGKYLNDNGVEAKLVIDPSMLLTKERYLSLLGVERKTNKKKYVFVYHLNKPKVLKDVSKKLSRALKCGEVVLNGVEVPVISGKKKFGDCSVPDFVRYINDAEYVITDSFHGVAFSIIMKKNFYAVIPPQRGQRLISLLQKLNLSDRIIHSADEVVLSDINYDDVYAHLNEIKEDSLDYLKEHINQ